MFVTAAMPHVNAIGHPRTRTTFSSLLDRVREVMEQRSDNGAAFRVSEFDLIAQRALWHRLHEDGCGAKAIATYMQYLNAAINAAAKPQIIERDGIETVTSILSTPIYIETSIKEIAAFLSAPLSKKKRTVPTYAELAAFLDALSAEHVFRYSITALNTWARPEAIMDMDFFEQIDLNTGLVDLNPPGRVQTKKRRPLIPLTDNLRGWHLAWGAPRPFLYQGVPVQSVKKSFGTASKRAGGPAITPYSLRHFMATMCRRVVLPSGRRVSKEQRSTWMGHVVNEGSTTTDWYEAFDPDFLEDARAATDQILRELDTLTTRSLFAPTALSQTRMAVISNDS